MSDTPAPAFHVEEHGRRRRAGLAVAPSWTLVGSGSLFDTCDLRARGKECGRWCVWESTSSCTPTALNCQRYNAAWREALRQWSLGGGSVSG